MNNIDLKYFISGLTGKQQEKLGKIVRDIYREGRTDKEKEILELIDDELDILEQNLPDRCRRTTEEDELVETLEGLKQQIIKGDKLK